MDLNSPLFDRVRIRTEEAEDRTRAQVKGCDHPGCQLAGDFRAPKGRFREGQFFHFCLPHVQAYNKSYNYFSGMSDDAISDYQKEALTGHRPTWTIGARQGSGDSASAGDYDPMGLFGGAGRARTKPEPAQSRYGALAKKALETLDLDETATAETIRAKYKAWVKRLHPDANGGDRSREDRLREIIRAYNSLKAAGHA
jgi:DnaJ domain